MWRAGGIHFERDSAAGGGGVRYIICRLAVRSKIFIWNRPQSLFTSCVFVAGTEIVINVRRHTENVMYMHCNESDDIDP